jgi:3-methyladenine DNA glycosylase Tag
MIWMGNAHKDDQTMFELFLLEVSGGTFSWITILKKREAFQRRV